MRKLLIATLLLFFAAEKTALATSDVVLNAMLDEMKRSCNKLKFEKYPAPYFLSYYVKEVEEAKFASVLGSRASVTRSRHRVVLPNVRIGDPELDSSNPLMEVKVRADDLPLDDDYEAIRRSLWKSTDSDYKLAIRTLEWKKAFLESNNVPHRLPDMAPQESVVSINKKDKLDINEEKWRKNIQALSKVFKNYPDLQKSKVSMVARTITIWYVNSEGSRVKDSNTKFILKLYASTQASDGMPVYDRAAIGFRNQDQFSSLEGLKDYVRRFASKLTKVSKGTKAIDYCGPVLFKGQAAACFFSQLMAPNLGFAEDYIGGEKFRNPLKNTIGRKILPNYLSVTSDPGAVSFKGMSLIGGYNFDHEGVPGQKVQVVENGRLKEFCRSRIPTTSATGSNGHGFGGHGVTSILELTSSKTVTPKELEIQIQSAARDAGLDYILVIEKMNDSFQLREMPSSEDKKLYFDLPSYTARPSSPTVAYRLYFKDGRKEYLRGLEFNYVSLRAFRDILAVEDDAAPYLVEPSDLCVRHLITPSYLVGELDLRPVKPEYSTTPIVPNPLLGEKTSD